MRVKGFAVMGAIALAFVTGTAMAAPVNEAPPAGPVIFNLDGTPIPHEFRTYTTSFVAGSATTDFSFAFREDPSFLRLDNVSVSTGGGINIVANGDFEAGPNGAQAPAGWTYDNVYGSAAGGTVRSGTGVGGSFGYYDGSVQAYDAITQQLTTVVGATYTVSFDLTDNGPYTTFSALSTNGNTTGTGGNGVNLLVYAGQGIPTPSTVPLPGTAPLFGAALLALAAAGYGMRRGTSASG